MSIHLTKKGILVFSIIGLILLGGATSFILWRVQQNDPVAPTESEAGGNGSGNDCGCTGACPSGWSCNCTADGGHVCIDAIRCHCCDGTWAMSEDRNCNSACGSKGYGDCTTTSQECWCQSFTGCGVNCTFPSGTQGSVNNAVNGTCGRKMAFCNLDGDGNTTVSISDPGACWSERNVCKNPTAEEICDTNVCDGGDILEQTASLHIGEPIIVTGWAYDETGIDTTSIAVTIDGTFVGNATATAGCPTQTSTCNSTHKNPVTWSYTFTASANEHNVSVKWKDIEGKESAACTAAQTLSRINVCEGGGIVPQTTSIEIGDNVTITGWAYDEDGINVNKIPINIDGTFAGDATTATGCPPQASNCDPNDPNVITWTYTFTSTAIAHVVSAVWEDTTGLTGDACKASQTISLNLENPDWSMTKVASGQCDETDPDNPIAAVDYVIAVTNNAGSTKEITTIVDTLDPKVQASWVVTSSINPTGTLSGNTITWNLTGDLASFTAGQTKTFKYTVIIPENAFGTYVNTVVATPADSSSSFSATETVIASCQPHTGLFDTSLGRITLSSLIILMSAAYLAVDGDNLRLSKWFTKSSRVKRKRKNFEKDI